MMQHPLIYVLFVIHFIFVLAITRRSHLKGLLNASHVSAIYRILTALALWAGLGAYMSIQGALASDSFLALLPGFWFPAVPIVICLLFFASFPALRDALRIIIDNTPAEWFVYHQALRISALGTLVRAWQGAFPMHLEIGLGITDLLFGFSALYIAKQIQNNSIDWKKLAQWHIIGAAIILLPIGLLFQMGLPGPLFIFTTPPTTQVLFQFPLVLAPLFAVPFFIVMNLLVAWRLFEIKRVP